MYCNQQGNPVFSCTAKAKVAKRDVGSFFLYSCDDHHNHLANKADVTAEELKQRMGEIVKNSPHYSTLAEVPDMVNETEIDGKKVGPCNLCYEAAKQENPQCKCCRCSNVVCSILCSIQDP